MAIFNCYVSSPEGTKSKPMRPEFLDTMSFQMAILSGNICVIHQMEWGAILASPITSASQPNSSQGFRVLGFHGSIPVLSGVMHQSQTQRLKPNKHCCWELASPFFAAIHHQHGGFDQQQNMVIWVVYAWLISMFLMEIAILWVSQRYPRHSKLQPWPWVPNNEQVG